MEGRRGRVRMRFTIRVAAPHRVFDAVRPVARCAAARLCVVGAPLAVRRTPLRLRMRTAAHAVSRCALQTFSFAPHAPELLLQGRVMAATLNSRRSSASQASRHEQCTAPRTCGNAE